MENADPPVVPEGDDVVMTEQEETTQYPITPTKSRKRRANDTPDGADTLKLAKDTTLVSASKPSPRQRFALRCINLGGPFQSRWTSTCLEKYGVKEPHSEFGIRLQIYRSSVSLESLPLAEESCTHLFTARSVLPAVSSAAHFAVALLPLLVPRQLYMRPCSSVFLKDIISARCRHISRHRSARHSQFTRHRCPCLSQKLCVLLARLASAYFAAAWRIIIRLTFAHPVTAHVASPPTHLSSTRPT
ncbi:hypothetical protein D6C92_03951 [Aureobasidium pullulans]|nr:hypothetical protein D6C92_03951 [Aureobasidium pullulans]TIA16935.1 hypothetical protein D6C81_05779 [Aureobasidium pullulans]